MIVAVDGSCWTHHTGFGRYVRELVRALVSRHPEIDVRLVLGRGVSRDAIPAGVAVVELTVDAEASNTAEARSSRAFVAALRAYAAIDADVVWMPSLIGYVPVLRRVPVIVGIHDAIGHQFGRALFGRRRDALAWRLKTRLALMQAARIVTVSGYARARLQRVLRIPAERLRIVGEAAAPVFVPGPPDRARATAARIGLACGVRDLDASPFVIYHGAFAPHKNLARLLDAFGAAVAHPALADVRLVLVGGAFRGTPGADGEDTASMPDGGVDHRRGLSLSKVEAALIRTAVARLPGRVVFTGRLEDEPLRDLLSAATAAVLPSLEEGYGLTAIEASACGTPVIATRNSAIPEVLGEGALIVDPLDTSVLTTALTRVLSDAGLRSHLIEHASRRHADLTWGRASDQLAAIFREAVGR